MHVEPYLRSERLIVRLGRPDDAAAVVRYYVDNAAHLADAETVRPPEMLTEHHWRVELAARREQFREDRSCKTFLFDRADDARVLGAANLSEFVRGAFQACYLGYSLDGGHVGRGLMHEALGLLIPYAFEVLDLHRIMANHMPRNERSARVLARLGFVVEGRAREYLRINGVWEDHILCALVRPGPP